MSENVKNQELANLEAMFKDYKTKQTEDGSSKKVGKSDILTKYFSPRNDDEVFRPLPPLEGRAPIEEAYFHRVETIGGGGKKQYSTLYCPRHNDPKIHKKDENGVPMYDGTKPVMIHEECPLCAEYDRILSTQDNSLRGRKKEDLNAEELKIFENNREIYKNAVKWKADKYYIIKGIDKGAIKDGPKFWRFKHNWQNQGTLDKLLPVMASFTEVNEVPYYDVNKGADLKISSTDSAIGNIKFKSIVSIMALQKPLSADEVQAKEWVNDELIWRDVFKKRNIPNTDYTDYLKMIVDGNTPYWDESDPKDKKWRFPNNPELERLANTRTMNLDNASSRPVEQASDLMPQVEYAAPAEHTPVVEVEKDEPKVVEQPKVEEPKEEKPVVEEPKVAEQPVETPQPVETQHPAENIQAEDDLADDDDYDDLPF